MKVIPLCGCSKDALQERLQVLATAGSLSRAKGTVSDVFESRGTFENDLEFVKKVMGYGHTSICEHDYVVFGLQDITPIAEQTLLGYRLSSFTVKSRREVDFRNVGYYVPEFKDENGNILENNERLQEIYNNYMQSLFNKYGELVDEGLPFEDCRYILPYSYHSNMIMGCDANELYKVVCDLRFGKESHITELKELGDKLYELVKEYVPYLTDVVDNQEHNEKYEDHLAFLDDYLNIAGIKYDYLLDGVKLVNYTPNADKEVLIQTLKNRYQISYEDAEKLLVTLEFRDDKFAEKMINALLHSGHQRELEHASFTFEMPISLAVMTHISRHRMQSLMIPDFVPMWNLERYVTPDSLVVNHEEQYNEVYAENKIMFDYFKEQGVRDEDLVYFYLSGNACNISTTTNARNLEWMSRMRCCNKAQWEIRNIMNECARQAAEVAPLLGKTFGPSCQVMKHCPEGKDSCKNKGVTVKKLVNKDSK